MGVVIKVDNLSKAYQIGQFSTGTISNDLKRWWALRNGKEDPYLMVGEENDRTKSGGSNIVWSLKDVGFSVQAGDSVGIIGRNGAGKSTLLKLLSQITAPTSGNIKINGRVASLLEVGTGFHPELSGRENIFLNGAILGMTKTEIKRKFDEIVDFSGVERYLDTPVKRYSSGMYVRLAFAVAAHLETEILIIDEVLAVGDVEFQKKCLGKMNDITRSDGRTILFVSHNLPMIASLCAKGIVLDKGKLVFDGLSSTAINYYQNGENLTPGKVSYPDENKRPGDSLAELVEAYLVAPSGEVSAELNIAESFSVKMKYAVKKGSLRNAYPNFHFLDQFGQYVFVTSPNSIKNDLNPNGGVYEAECMIPANFFNAGNFSISIAFTADYNGANTSFYEQNALNFSMIEDLNNSPTRIGNYGGAVPGIIRPILDWEINKK
jgi:lipopolysaccharide transport system ATP-binding protein